MRLKSVLAVLCLNIVLLPALVRAQGDSVGDPYFPLSGNTGYDVQHYTLEFDVRDDLLTFDAVATIDIQATAALAQFDLDLVGFAVTSVTVDSVEAAFTREGQELIIVPPTPIAADTLFTVIVSYNGTAELYDDPATAMVKTLSGASLNGGWQAWSEGYVQAMSQPNGAMSWYPCNNHPSDKATFTFRVTVDEPYTVVASGILEEVSAVDDDTNTFVWEMTDPMATQISSIAIGEFELEESVSPGGIPLRFYFPPSTPEATRDAFVRTGEMIDFMSEVMGGYPTMPMGRSSCQVGCMVPRSKRNPCRFLATCFRNTSTNPKILSSTRWRTSGSVMP